MSTTDSAETPRHDYSRTATVVASGAPSKQSVGTDVEVSSPSESQDLSRFRKVVVLCVLCSAQFFDVFNSSAVIVSLPSLGQDLHFTSGTLSWFLAAYTLTFASFLLISGAISDVFHPKPMFCMGFAFVGFFSIPVAASTHPIMSIVFRSMQGIGAALNVPSAVSMIRHTFPIPLERSTAYAAYTIAGTIGNIIGLVIGGVLSARTSWRWVHYLVAIMVVPSSAAAWFLLPPHTTPPKDERRRIDISGVVTLTIGLVLFVYAVSDGNDAGWGSPKIIATLVLSVVICTAFFFVEMHVKNPALPAKTWSNKNFTALFVYALSPYWWCSGCLLQIVNVFTILWHDTAIIAAIRCLPIGVAGGIAVHLAGKLTSRLNQKHVLVYAQVCMAIAAVLFALADTANKYWSLVFPGMIVGLLGLGPGFTACTNMFMDGARKGEEAVVGAVMYTSYQIGSTLGFAIVTSITQGVNARDPISQFEGYAASFWSLVALPGIMVLVTLVFVRQ